MKIMSVGRSVRDPHVVKVRLTNWPRLRDKIQSHVNKDDSLKIPLRTCIKTYLEKF